MILKTGKTAIQPQMTQFLVLVPHRDIRRLLRAWSASLFAAGLEGAWSFPWVAALAQLRRPLAAETLKHLARQLRHEVNLVGGKFFTNGFAQRHVEPVIRGAQDTEKNSTSAAPHEVFGHVLQIEPSDSFFELCGEEIIRPFAPVILGSALHSSSSSVPLTIEATAPPEITFRVAALANMSFRPLNDGQDGYSFEWRIGTLHWLPNALPDKPTL